MEYSFIDLSEILQQFRMTLSGSNPDYWSGDVKYLGLYDVWRSLITEEVSYAALKTDEIVGFPLVCNNRNVSIEHGENLNDETKSTEHDETSSEQDEDTGDETRNFFDNTSDNFIQILKEEDQELLSAVQNYYESVGAQEIGRL